MVARPLTPLDQGRQGVTLAFFCLFAESNAETNYRRGEGGDCN